MVAVSISEAVVQTLPYAFAVMDVSRLSAECLAATFQADAETMEAVLELGKENGYIREVDGMYEVTEEGIRVVQENVNNLT